MSLIETRHHPGTDSSHLPQPPLFIDGEHIVTDLNFQTMTQIRQTQPPQRSLALQFVLGGTATTAACIFTNPIEVVKTRLQVQGELHNSAARIYRNPFHAFVTIVRTEGLRGIQGGLGPAMLYQCTMNGTRLGLYEPIKRIFEQQIGQQHFLSNVLAGASSGVLAAFIGSPFFMIKVRLQVLSQPKPSVNGIVTPTIGAQHVYTSAWSGLRHVYVTEGIRGLYRGASAAMVRVGIGSAVQLSTYDWCKSVVLTHMSDGIAAHFMASLLSGVFVTLAMNPPDVISTRLYNQPVQDGKGLLYTNVFDCAVKTVKSEGVTALYKGLTAHYLRLGPHTILTFVFWEQLKAAATKLGY